MQSFVKRVCTWEFLNLILLGLGFMVVFSAFNPTSSYMSSLHKELGYASLAVLYSVFGISIFFAPTIERILGAKWCMILASIMYNFYTLFAIVSNPWSILISSALVGFSASVIWTAQGAYLTRIAGDDMGLFSGIFFALFYISSFGGNIAISTLLTVGIPKWIAFLVIFVVGFVGTFLFLFLLPMNKVKAENDINGDVPKKVEIGILKSIEGSVLILFERKIFLIMSLSCLSGYSSAFFGGKVPELVSTHVSINTVGFVMATRGASSIIGSIFFGKLIDSLGRKPMLCITLFLNILAVGFTFVMHFYPPYLYFVSSFLNGLAGSTMNTMIYSILGVVYKDRASDAFAAHKFVQSMSFSAGFVVSIFAPLLGLQLLGIYMILVCMLFLLILDTYVMSL
jgi:MFS family permease